MRIALFAVLSAMAVAGCATPQQQQAKTEVDAVVVDENARQEAAKVARKTGESADALKAADAVSTREPATRPQ